MKKLPLTKVLLLFRYCLTLAIVAVFSISLFSFRAKKFTNDLFGQLGISQSLTDSKITNSFIGGYVDGLSGRKLSSIAVADRAIVTKDLLQYTKQFVNGDTYKKAYAQLKERNKPAQNKLQTPAEMRKGLIDSYTKAVSQMEESVKKADASMKKIFEDMLVESKKNLKDAQDPNNEMIKNYESNYDMMLKTNEATYQQQMEMWEEEYPTNHMVYIKRRLQQFLDETKAIDFNAELIERNGKKFFVNPAYERKSNRWKMAFRAGKEVVEPARAFVQQWLTEIK